MPLCLYLLGMFPIFLNRNSIAPALLFLLMNGAVISTSYLIARRCYSHLGRRAFIEAVFLFYIAEIILVETILGMLGLLNITTILATISAIFIAVLFTTKKHPKRSTHTDTRIFPRTGLLTGILWAGALLFLAAMIAQAIITPPYAWDSYTYHNHFPITWMKEGGISIIPTPFGHSLVAYVACNGELFFLWLILPFHQDFLTGLGQLPFLFIGALSLYGIAREMGTGRKASSWACLLFIFAPAVIAQAVHPYVDIIFAALFLLSVEFLIHYWRDGKLNTLILLAVSLGLLFGTKGLALPYSLLILPPIIFILLRKRARTILKLATLGLGLISLGGFWYIRNYLVTGNPIYPLDVNILGITFFPGIYSRETLMRAFPHIINIAEAIQRARMTFGAPLAWLILCSIPLSVYAFWADKRRTLMTGYILSLPFLSIILFQFLTPGHHVERLLLIVIPFFALYPAYATTIHRAFKYIVGWAVAACLILTVWHNHYLINMVKFVCITAFGYKAGGIPPARPAIVWTLITILLFLVCLALRNRKNLLRLCSLFTLIAVAASLSEASKYFSTDSYKYTYRISWPHTIIAGFALTDSYGYKPKSNLLEDAWLFLDRHTQKGTNIAWAGLNMPGALYGSGLKNNVYYVNINSHYDWKDHDYSRLYRIREGQRLSLTTKPAYHRRDINFSSWLNNLRRKNIHYLFVTYLSHQEKQYLRHDPEGFPLEGIWARQNPEFFTLVYKNPQVRIYRVE